MPNKTLICVLCSLASFTAGSSHAAVVKHAIAPAVEINGLRIAPNYLTGVEMKTTPMGGEMGEDAIHLEADVHATKDEQHGFPEGSWVPYLTIDFTLTKDDSSFKKQGTLVPMSAKVGPHYANEVEMAGPGTYQLTYRVAPQAPNTLVLHSDPETGVPPWWQPFTLHWTFEYPIKKAQ